MILNHPPTSSSSSFPGAKPFVGVVENTVTALRLVQAAKLGIIPRTIRRLTDEECRRLILSGAVFVFSVEESGMKRWTDGRVWSPSRIVGNFLVYQEMQEKKDSSKLIASNGPEDSSRRGKARNIHWDSSDANRLRYKLSLQKVSSRNRTPKSSGLNKKTITVIIEGTDFHLVSYYTQEDLKIGCLKTLPTRPEVANLVLEPRIFRLGSFRIPPKIVLGPDGKSTIASPEPETEPQEHLTDELPHRATGSPEYGIGIAESSIEIPRPRRPMYHDGSSTTSMSPGHASTWREEYEYTPTMVNQYQQDAYGLTTASSAEPYLTDGHLDYRTPDALFHAIRGEELHQSLPESSGSQYPEIYAQSPSYTTAYRQRKVTGLTDGSGYEESVRHLLCMESPDPSQRTQISHGYPTSGSVPTFSATKRSNPDHSRQATSFARQMYTDGQWYASASSRHEYTVSLSQSQSVQHFPDTQRVDFYSATGQDGAGHQYYKREGYEDRFTPGDAPN